MRKVPGIGPVFIALFFVSVASIPKSSTAQGHHHGGQHHSWPDSLNVVTLSGTAIVDSSVLRPLYYLDVTGDAMADYLMNFGPWWYQPTSGAVRPQHGDSLEIVGALFDHANSPMIIIFTISGLKWRDPIEVGQDGWNGHGFWNMGGDTLTASGTALVDTTYFYPHYFLDTDNDSIPEYHLGFGPPWYEPASGATRPNHGDAITVLGLTHTTGMGIEMLIVSRINGLEWTPLDGPALWAGGWMHRNHSDTTRFSCINDSTQWLEFPPGHMGHGMGGMMWPDSVFVQYWRVHPDSLPGEHVPEYFMGFYFDTYDPQGNTMMGGMHSMMRFQRAHRIVWHYTDAELQSIDANENVLQVHYWDAQQNQWRVADQVTVNAQTNTVTLTSSDSYSYYALFALQTTTNVDQKTQPSEFVLYPAYPNPFNPETRIEYQLPKSSTVRLAVYNPLGQLIKILVEGKKQSGRHSVTWDGRNIDGRRAGSGAYFVRFQTGDFLQTQRVLLLK